VEKKTCESCKYVDRQVSRYEPLERFAVYICGIAGNAVCKDMSACSLYEKREKEA